jgi:hypothetical protein
MSGFGHTFLTSFTDTVQATYGQSILDDCYAARRRSVELYLQQALCYKTDFAVFWPPVACHNKYRLITKIKNK